MRAILAAVRVLDATNAPNLAPDRPASAAQVGAMGT